MKSLTLDCHMSEHERIVAALHVGAAKRAAGKAFEQMLARAGASIGSMASSEIYNAKQTGVLDTVNTSSSSFVSFRIHEQVKCYRPAGDVLCGSCQVLQC